MSSEEFYKNENYESVIITTDIEQIKQIRKKQNFNNNQKLLQADLGYYTDDIQICHFSNENELITRFKEANDVEKGEIVHLLETLQVIKEESTFDIFKTLFDQFYANDSTKFEKIINIIVKQKFKGYEDFLIEFYHKNISQNLKSIIFDALINTKYEKQILEDYINKKITFIPISFAQSQNEEVAMIGLESIFSLYENGKITVYDFFNEIDLNNQLHHRFLVQWREKRIKGSTYIESMKNSQMLNKDSKIYYDLITSWSYYPLNKQDKLFLCHYLINKEKFNLLIFIKKMFDENDIEEVYRIFEATIFKNQLNSYPYNEKILKFETYKLLRLNSKFLHKDIDKFIEQDLISKQVNSTIIFNEIQEKSLFYVSTGDFGYVHNDHKTSYFSLNILIEKYISGFSTLFIGNDIKNLFFNHDECLKNWVSLYPKCSILKDYELSIVVEDSANLKITLLKDNICFTVYDYFDGINLSESLIPLYNSVLKYENIQYRLFPSNLYPECSIFMLPEKYFLMIDLLK